MLREQLIHSLYYPEFVELTLISEIYILTKYLI